jgi:metal-responsive CopG/Arc/MetJ family transcriptional regulator
MENAVAVHLPRELVERVDVVARDELRSRTNAIAWMLDQELRRREPAKPVEVS